MSHFTVLVIGPDVEAQLAPFDENLEAGPRFVEVDADALARSRSRRVEAGALSHTLEELAAEITEWGGGKHIVRDGKVFEVDTANADGHWDWWVVGGRWAGFFPLKSEGEGRVAVQGHSTPQGWVPATTRPVTGRDTQAGPKVNEFYEPTAPAHADQCEIGVVDFDKAREASEAEARDLFAQWRACFDGQERALPWSHFLAEVEAKRMTLDDARSTYRTQAAVAAWEQGEGKFSLECVVDDLGYDEKAYVARRRDAALVPYAYVKDGKWRGRGEMGWFGCSHGDMDRDAWNREIAALYASLPPNTQVTLVDCHV